MIWALFALRKNIELTKFATVKKDKLSKNNSLLYIYLDKAQRTFRDLLRSATQKVFLKRCQSA